MLQAYCVNSPCCLPQSWVCSAHAVIDNLQSKYASTHRCCPGTVVPPTCTCCMRLPLYRLWLGMLLATRHLDMLPSWWMSSLAACSASINLCMPMSMLEWYGSTDCSVTC